MLSNQQSSEKKDATKDEILQNKALDEKASSHNNKQKKQIIDSQSETIRKIQQRRNRKGLNKNGQSGSMKTQNISCKGDKNHKNRYHDKEDMFLKENEE